MEKDHKPSKSKLKSTILKLLPRAAAAVTFQNPPFSPGRAHAGAGARGFSGPIVSIVPQEARRKTKSEAASFETQEPTSPKVSCMGKIKQQKIYKRVEEKKKKKKKKEAAAKVPEKEDMKKAPAMRRMSSSVDRREEEAAAPSLSQLKRFASGRRDAFDWTSQIAPVEAEQRNCFSDEEKGRSDDGDDEDEEEEENIIPFSAPIMVGGDGGDGDAMKPRKEVNLWKRRTMVPPGPLKLTPK